MELSIILELEKDKGLHDYLKSHSFWYRSINRDKANFDRLKKEYKAFKREKNINTINNAVENIELVSNIIKFVE